MKNKSLWRKLFKISFIIGLCFFVLFSVLAGILVNFIFTPEKLTPKLLEIANEHIEADFDVKSAELTLFSSFPNFGVELQEGSLKNQNDSLVFFEKAKVEINLSKLILKKAIDLKEVSLEKAFLNMQIDEEGHLNWDVFQASESEGDSEFKIEELTIKRLKLDQASLKYTNHQDNDFVDLQNLKAFFRMSYDKGRILAQLKSNFDRLQYVKEGFELFNNKDIELKTAIEYLEDERKLSFRKGELAIKGVGLLLNGVLQADVEKEQVYTDLTLQLKVPNLKSVLDLIPEHIVQKEKINIQGDVDFLAEIKGAYGKDSYPITEIKANIKEGQFQYVDYPGSINRIESAIQVRFDFEDKASSHFTLNEMELQGFGIELQGDLSMRDLLVEPKLNSDVAGFVDLTKLNQVIPFHPDISVDGIIDTDIKTSFDIKQLQEQDFSSLAVEGRASLKNIDIEIPKDTLSLKVQDLVFHSQVKEDDSLEGDLFVRDIHLQKAVKKAKAERLNIDFSLQDAESANSLLIAGISLGKFAIHLENKDQATLEDGKLNLKIRGNEKYDARVTMESDFVLDSLGVYYDNRFAAIKTGDYKMELIRKGKRDWEIYGDVHFDKMIAYTPELGKAAFLHNSKLNVINNKLELEDTQMKFGNSDLTFSGNIDNYPALIWDTISNNKVKARLLLNSEFIDSNELMAVFNSASEEEIVLSPEEILEAADADLNTETELIEDKKLFEIPDNIDFVVQTKVNKLRFGTSDIEDISGDLIIKDGELRLADAKMKTLAAELYTNLRYKYLHDKEAELRFDFNLHKIEMERLSEFMPALDTLFPMASSFEGLVDFRLRGISKINENMGIKTSTVKGIAAIQASNIMIFDSETFRSLAKTMMFKSKEKNPVEELNVEMIIRDNQVEFLPSYLSIDRYELALGGKQNLDMSYDYHISVLKSPVPFKAGVDIKGQDFDDYKINLTNAKYKYYFTDKKRLLERADSSIIKKREAVLKLLGLDEQ